MAEYMNFSSDVIDVYLFLLDASGSMDSESQKVIDGMRCFIESFRNFPQVNSIAVAITTFDSDFHPSEFRHIEDICQRYEAGGSTALYYSINEGAELLKGYMARVAEKTNIQPRGTFIVFSDGESYHDHATESSAKETINDLNLAGINTVFVAFGDSITSEFGKRMGFNATKDVRNKKDITDFLGRELSQSLKEQSMSLTSLGANFFSHANSSDVSGGYSQTTQEALDDDSWIKDI